MMQVRAGQTVRQRGAAAERRSQAPKSARRTSGHLTNLSHTHSFMARDIRLLAGMEKQNRAGTTASQQFRLSPRGETRKARPGKVALMTCAYGFLERRLSANPAETWRPDGRAVYTIKRHAQNKWPDINQRACRWRTKWHRLRRQWRRRVRTCARYGARGAALAGQLPERSAKAKERIRSLIIHSRKSVRLF